MRRAPGRNNRMVPAVRWADPRASQEVVGITALKIDGQLPQHHTDLRQHRGRDVVPPAPTPTASHRYLTAPTVREVVPPVAATPPWVQVAFFSPPACVRHTSSRLAQALQQQPINNDKRRQPPCEILDLYRRSHHTGRRHSIYNLILKQVCARFL